MNTTSRIAALALTLAAAGSAFADDLTLGAQTPASTLTRAEVRADLDRALAAHTLRNHEADLNVLPPVASQRTRAEVRAETLQAIATGELRALSTETGSPDRVLRVAPAARVAPAQVAAVSR